MRLTGPSDRGPRLSNVRLKILLDVLTKGTQRALRLRMDGRSTAKGPIPAWLRAATAFDIVGLSAGSTILQLEVEPLSRSSPERFSQGDLFSSIDPARTSLGVFTESLGDAMKSKADSDNYDSELVETFMQFEGVLADGIDSIDFVGEGPLTLREGDVEALRRLRRATPPPQRVRLAGKLDSIRHSDRMFTLILKEGHVLRGVAGEVAPDMLAGLFGQEAVVSGQAVFRPSGTVLRVVADQIELAVGDTTVWSKVPVAAGGGLDPRTLRRSQGPRSGLHAVFGNWPGDETEEEVLNALARLS